jgi:hypothetical protein
MTRRTFLRPLIVVTLANYVALVPYYLHNDASTQHPLPAVRAIALTGLTLVWFLAGVHALERQRRWGRPVLISFLITEAALYVKTFVTGAVVYQMHNPSDLVRAVFIVGYVSGAVALVYIVLLARHGGGTSNLAGHRSSGQDNRVSGGGDDQPGAPLSIDGVVVSG